MFIPASANINGILAYIKPTIEAVFNSSSNGIDIEIKKHNRKRTTDQNSYLWAIYQHIVEFYNETGFAPDNINVRFLNADLLHAYFKARFDVKTTTKMSTAEFSKYVDSIQLLMTEQTKGEYSPIYPEIEGYDYEIAC